MTWKHYMIWYFVMVSRRLLVYFLPEGQEWGAYKLTDDLPVIWNAKTLLWRPWYSKLKYIGFYTHEGKSSNFEIGDILGCVVWFAHPKLYYSLAWCHIDDVILWTHPQCYRHFMRGIQQSSFDYHHKGQVTRTCDVSLLFAWTHYSIISHPGDLRRCNTDRLFWHHGKQISISPD